MHLRSYVACYDFMVKPVLPYLGLFKLGLTDLFGLLLFNLKSFPILTPLQTDLGPVVPFFYLQKPLFVSKTLTPCSTNSPNPVIAWDCYILLLNYLIDI